MLLAKGDAAMSASLDLNPVLSFLAQLKENNERPWFQEHRAEYDLARQRFELLVGRLIEEFSAFEPLAGVSPEECMMRIYRDVRFSKDKSPYRTAFGASIGPGGRKSSSFSYYFQLGSHGESMIAGGLYDPAPEQLARFRSAIDSDPGPFKTVIGAPEFIYYYGTVGGERVKTVPQGYSRDHPEIELLRFKQVVVMHSWADEAVIVPGFTSEVVTAAKALKPFLDFLNATVRP